MEKYYKRRIINQIVDGIEKQLNAIDLIDDKEPTDFTDEVQILIEKYRERE